MGVVVFDEVHRESCLAEVDGDVIVGARPLVVGAKEPVNVPHEFNCDHSHEKVFKSALNLRVFREVNEVVNVYAKSERS
jgi:hypothetical protein